MPTLAKLGKPRGLGYVTRMNEQDLQVLVDIISGDRPPRVWSLLVTVFGELAQDTPCKVSGTMLNQLTGLLGIRPEAMRVALHRLRKDGWIESQRDGRTSTYRLTEWGRAQSAKASPRIYAATPTNHDAWLVHFDPAMPIGNAERVGVAITPSMFVCAHPPNSPRVFETKIDDSAGLPAWLRAKICDPVTSAQSQRLATKLASLRDAMRDANSLTDLQIAAIRILIVHTWRRIILKAPELPDAIFPKQWAGPECRLLVAELLQKLPKKNVVELNAQVMRSTVKSKMSYVTPTQA